MKQGLSIKYKILILLLLVPLITLAVYLVVAVHIFEKDKIPYVFETTSAVSNTLAAQASTELTGVLSLAKPVMQEFVLSREFGKVARSVLDSETNLEWVAAFGVDSSGRFEKLGIVEKFAAAGERDLQSFGDLTPLLSEAMQQSRLVRVPFKNEKVLLVEKVGENPQDVRIFLMMASLQNLANSFRASGGAQVFLVNPQGFVLFGPVGTEATYVSQKVDLDLATELQKQAQPVFTKEVKNTKNEDILASVSKLNFGHLAVVSLVEKKEALRAVQDLIHRSIYFFLALVAACTLVSLFASGTVTAALTDLFRATKQVSEGHFDIQVPVNSTDEIGSLAQSFNTMAAEVSRLLSETAEKARMESELKTAQTVQETLFPATEAKLGNLNISGYYEPASECGGDWWHYCQVGSKIFLWIGDATGHGAPAALITSAAKSAATIIERLNVDCAQAMTLLNRAIYDVSKGRIMMTFFLACYDPETRQLTYANASHEAPFLIRPQEGKLKKKDLLPLNEVTSPRLGQERDTIYEQVSIRLEPGDRLFFYTDGVPDIQNPSMETWGEREFIKSLVASNQEYPPIHDSVQRMVEVFSEYRQKAPLKDDVTFFMAQVGEGPI
jgi:sigma-B regulation protein RsbU (phosphoserine phosphatase)